MGGRGGVVVRGGGTGTTTYGAPASFGFGESQVRWAWLPRDASAAGKVGGEWAVGAVGGGVGWEEGGGWSVRLCFCFGDEFEDQHPWYSIKRGFPFVSFSV